VWERADVAVVDAADHRREDDQFPGVAVVEHARRAVPAGRRTPSRRTDPAARRPCRGRTARRAASAGRTGGSAGQPKFTSLQM
jgi:hypothetical protein